MVYRITTLLPVKVLGWFFYVALLTKWKHESKQCQKKYAESQHIFEIEMISHRHHPHSLQNRGQPTLQHGCPCVYHIRLRTYVQYLLRKIKKIACFKISFAYSLQCFNVNIIPACGVEKPLR